jgi:transglutaminase-like putative cysteine protease
MTNFDPAPGDSADPTRVVTCDMTFRVSEPTEVVVQVVASKSAGRVDDARLEILIDGAPPSSVVELSNPRGEALHVIGSDPGELTVSYRARIRSGADGSPARRGDEAGVAYDRQVYLRPSRYCPSDHLVGFAVAEFGAGPDTAARVAAIAEWIRQRIGYVPGSSTVHDSAEDTLLTGMGTCRDFAHLGVALCRATGVPARFAAVYAPGLSPMDFHAVFEAFQDGRWCVYDSTGLAPRSSLVRIVTGRDAADTAFAAVTTGIADLLHVEVTAVADPVLPTDEPSEVMVLA